MKLKKDVRVFGIRPEVVLALQIAETVWLEHGEELVITSATDSQHSNTSRHYLGCAADLRTNYFLADQVEKVAKELRDALGEDFYVLVHKTHIHLSFKPKAIMP